MQQIAVNKPRRNSRAADLAYIALGAVLIALCSWMSIPITVPFTMQTFAVFCVLSLLGGKRGTMALLVYMLLGAVGLPVFSGFGSGIGVLLGHTGGYIVGFFCIGLLYWGATALWGKKLWVEILSLVVGLLACYAFGTVWYMLVYARAGESVGVAAALGLCVLPFVLPDLIKLALALVLARRVGAAIKLR